MQESLKLHTNSVQIPARKLSFYSREVNQFITNIFLTPKQNFFELTKNVSLLFEAGYIWSDDNFI